MENVRILIAGGGTGGHYFCGLAVAEVFLQEFPKGAVHLVGTRYGIEARTPLSDPRMRLHFIRSRGVKGRGLLSKVVALLWFFVGCVQSLELVLRLRPKFVLGVGGYASGAPVLMALLLRRTSVFVLEQNSHVGLANRFLVRMGAKPLSTFPFPGFQLVPMPLRSRLREAEAVRFEWPPKTILVMGGSQGARGLNRKWLEVVPLLRQAFPEMKIIHQTGREDQAGAIELYQKVGWTADVFAFHDPMIEKYRQADLVVCRSGALTVFELVKLQMPAIFVPFPAATDAHQEKNALFVQDPEWVIPERELTAERVLRCLRASIPQIPAPKILSRETWPQILRQNLRS